MAEAIRCWEIFRCDETHCPAHGAEDRPCWTLADTACEVHGEISDKPEACLDCEVLKRSLQTGRTDGVLAAMRAHFARFRVEIERQTALREDQSAELATGVSEVLEALRKISEGDPTVRIPEESPNEVVGHLKHEVNRTAEEIGHMIDQSHEFAMGLAEHFDVLQRVTGGDLKARVQGGAVIPILESLANLTNGMIESVAGNIAERKTAEDALKESQERLVQVTDSSGGWVWEVDPEGRFTYSSPVIDTILGYRPEELVGKKHLCDFFVPEVRKAREQEVLELFANRISIEKLTARQLHKNGNIVTLQATATPHVDAEGNLLGYRGVSQDITKRKLVEEMLEQAKERAELIYRVVPSAIFTVDRDRIVTSWNDKAAEVTGYSSGEAVGKCCSMFAEPPCSSICGLYSDDVPKPVIGEECTIRRKDGTIRTVWKNADVMRDGHGRVMGGIESFEDITEQKLADERVAAAQETKSRFLSVVSHELRTPLTAIKEGIGIVADESAGEINDDQREFLALAKTNVDRLARLINDVLDFQKLSAGKMILEMGKNNLNTTAEEVQRTMLPLAQEKGLTLEGDLCDTLPAGWFDKDRITQVITNLVSNAIKFTEKGGITVLTSMDGELIRVAVADTGPGISADEIPRLFHRFEQLGPGVKRKTGSTGLGLAISKEIVEQHAGAIWVESEVGKGTSFIFTVPRYGSQTAPQS